MFPTAHDFAAEKTIGIPGRVRHKTTPCRNFRSQTYCPGGIDRSFSMKPGLNERNSFFMLGAMLLADPATIRISRSARVCLLLFVLALVWRAPLSRASLEAFSSCSNRPSFSVVSDSAYFRPYRNTPHILCRSAAVPKPRG